VPRYHCHHTGVARNPRHPLSQAATVASVHSLEFAQMEMSAQAGHARNPANQWETAGAGCAARALAGPWLRAVCQTCFITEMLCSSCQVKHPLLHCHTLTSHHAHALPPVPPAAPSTSLRPPARSGSAY
jgi:hypothetical protein